MRTNIYSHDPVATENEGLRSAHLKNVFEDELRYIFWAETLYLFDVAELLSQTLDEEVSCDEKLAELTISSVHMPAAHPMDGELNYYSV